MRVGMDGPHRQATVLLVDQDEVRLGEIARDLDRAGFAVVAARTVGDAAAVLTVIADPVAAVVSDVDPSPLVPALERRNPAVFAVHTQGLLLPTPGVPTYSLGGSTSPEAIAGLVVRLHAPGRELT
jgi:hypothetical protein